MPEDELAEMKDFYLEELEKTRRRLDHISAVLRRLGEDVPSHDGAGKVRKTRKKPGRKPEWENLVMKRLRQLDRPVTYEELTDELMLVSKIPAEKRKKTKQAVINVIFRLRNRDQKVDTFSMGTREKYIALKQWFTKQGKIRREYAAKVDLPRRA